LTTTQRGRNFSDFTASHVVIAVPLYDEGLRNIKEEDEELYLAQEKDAYALQKFLMENTYECTVDIVLGAYDAHKIANVSNNVKHSILLHEFMPIEEDYITMVLRNNAFGYMDRKLNVYKLY